MIKSMLRKLILWALRDDSELKNEGAALDTIARDIQSK